MKSIFYKILGILIGLGSFLCGWFCFIASKGILLRPFIIQFNWGDIFAGAGLGILSWIIGIIGIVLGIVFWSMGTIKKPFDEELKKLNKKIDETVDKLFDDNDNENNS